MPTWRAALPLLQNLREAIASYRNRIYYEPNDERKQDLLQVRWGLGSHQAHARLLRSWQQMKGHAAHLADTYTTFEPTALHLFSDPLLQVCLEYLERYYFLLAFTAYLSGPCFDPGGPNHATFAEW